MTRKVATALALLIGFGMIFLGARFFFFPELAEADYGIRFEESGDYSFHYIKGIRDLFSGIVICCMLLSRQHRSLGIVLLAGTIIPIADLLIVLSKDYTGFAQAISHSCAIVICLFCGMVFVKPNAMREHAPQASIKMLRSAGDGAQSVVELSILPKERTPWHYHTLFDETFEIIEGTLEVGKGKEVHNLRKGEAITVVSGQRHYFHNTSNTACLIKVTISPSNLNFEKSLLILKGLANDGLGTKAGTPKKLMDLALFVFLNNSKMVGAQKIAEPFFSYLAKKAIRRGRLQQLEQKYCTRANIDLRI